MKLLLPTLLMSLSIVSNGYSQEPSPVQENPARAISNQLRWTHSQRLQAATKEFAARIAEYRGGRSPINVVLQSNQRLLKAALDAHVPNAGIAYDRRAEEVEALAQHMLSIGSGTGKELTQAKENRLDAMLRNSIGSSNSRKLPLGRFPNL